MPTLLGKTIEVSVLYGSSSLYLRSGKAAWSLSMR